MPKEFIIAFGILILIRVLAGTNNILGKICRWYWNTAFRIAAFIPFCGWMAHLIIGDKKDKEHYIKMGEEVDNWAFQAAEKSLNAEVARQKRDEAIRTKLQGQGYRDVTVNGDGSYATAKDKRGKTYNIRIDYE